jgi:hypothetical protein
VQLIKALGGGWIEEQLFVQTVPLSESSSKIRK